MLNCIKKSLENRGLEGDILLDCLDTAEDIITINGEVTKDGFAVMYHATSKENKLKIIQEKAMFGKEDGIFFSTKPDGQISGYGSDIVKTLIPLEDLKIDDEFSDEIHYKVQHTSFEKKDFKIIG